MTKQTVINKIIFFLSVLLIFMLNYLLQINLAIPLFLFVLFFYLKFRKQYLKNYNLLSLSLLFVIILSSAYIIIDRGWRIAYIPFCIIPMLTTLLFNQLELSLLITLASSFSVAAIAGNNFYLLIFFFVSGMLSSILVLGARRRMAIIRAGFLVGLLQAAMLFLIKDSWRGPADKYLFSLINGIVSSVIVLGILPVFEYLFKTVTNISLLELADFHHPLLERLTLEAPGTYHHSLIVGNLSEAACAAVGANALLARIGAYYHDIGKLSKPNYFSENQIIDASKHDKLSPSMSKIIIINHVKEGIELAKKYRLNPLIIDFIQQHHGNSLVYYFYRRALENSEENQEIKEEGFRYPGPKPNTKETAIVLLADSVEAATRSLKEPTPQKIEEVVHKIINNKFIDRQLDECELTLKDLEKIAEIFIRILASIYHSRITYPESSKT